jgi:hypothetical protein
MPKKPDFVCEECNRACFITESGYAGGTDHEPIDCDRCGKHLGDFRTSGYTIRSWTDWNPHA